MPSHSFRTNGNWYSGIRTQHNTGPLPLPWRQPLYGIIAFPLETTMAIVTINVNESRKLEGNRQHIILDAALIILSKDLSVQLFQSGPGVHPKQGTRQTNVQAGIPVHPHIIGSFESPVHIAAMFRQQEETRGAGGSYVRQGWHVSHSNIKLQEQP